MASELRPLSLTRTQLYFIGGAVCILLLLAAGVWWHQVITSDRNRTPSQAAAALEGSTVAANAYTNLAGEAVTLDTYLGRVLVVLSWASWCPSCAESLTQVRDLALAYPEAEVTYLAINRAEPKETAERYLNVMRIDADNHIILDPSDRYYQAIDGYAMPEIVIYNSAGEIHQRLRGRVTDAQIQAAIEGALTSE
ncbi:MAG: TlpA family protein disulfide reductase [Patescibacteria group bacterium]